MEENSQEIIKKYVKILSGSLPCNEAQYNTENAVLEDIEYLIHHLDLFVAAFPSDLSKSCVICKLCELIVGFGLVHQVSPDDR
ncbi:hypothetical protein AVEN_253336-1, partial [Araneus ventricosus]